MNLSEENINIVNRMYGLFSDLGALKELPGDKAASTGFLLRAWNKVITENPRWPQRGDFYTGFLASKFFSALVNGTAPRRGNNISALCQAFADWYNPEQERIIIDAYYLRFPHLRPKAIKPVETRLENWDDETIREQYEKINELFGGEYSNSLSGIPRASNYFRRIAAEYNRRFTTHQQPQPQTQNFYV